MVEPSRRSKSHPLFFEEEEMDIHLVVKASKGVVVDEYAFTDIGEAEDKGDDMRNSKDYNENTDDVCTCYNVRLQGIVYALSKADVIGVAKEMGIPEEQITETVLFAVEKAIPYGLDDWTEVVKTALKEALGD